jgi:DNA-binding IclR family transcriptional regulator
MARTGKPAVRLVESVQRAAAVLDVLGEEGADLGTNEIARRTGINVSTVSRILATLAEARLVEHIPHTGRYRLGVRILQLANTARRDLDLRGLARPHLDDLARITGETTTLSLPGEHEVLTIDFAQSAALVVSVAAVGRNSVPHATAVGKIFLAWGGRTAPGELARFTSRTITDRDRLSEELARVRRRGWAQAVGEREEQLNGVAVPVLDPTDRLVAILGVQGPSSRFGQRAMRAASALLVERAASLASVL